MRSFFTTIAATVFCAFTSFAQAADVPVRPAPRTVVIQAPAPAPQRAPDCVGGDLCKVYKSTKQHGLVQTNINLVCIRIQQAKPGIVVIRFYDDAGKELDAGNKQHSNIKNTVDTFCVGRHYLMKAQAGHIEICNDVKTKTLRPQEISILLNQGMPETAAVKLFAAVKG